MTATTVPNTLIDVDTLQHLATQHLAAATRHFREISGPHAGIQAEHVIGVDAMISDIEDSLVGDGDIVLAREWAARTGSVFAAGVEFGIAIAAAIIEDPDGNPRATATWVEAVDSTKDELQSIVDAAIKDAVNINEAERAWQPAHGLK